MDESNVNTTVISVDVCLMCTSVPMIENDYGIDFNKRPRSVLKVNVAYNTATSRGVPATEQSKLLPLFPLPACYLF